MKGLTFVLSFLVASTLAEEPLKNVTFSLFATDLHGCDSLSACDPFTKIMCASISSDWKECGRTSIMRDDNFPVWPEIFVFPNISSDQLRFRFDIFDEDVTFNDLIDSFSCSLTEFLEATVIQSTHRHDISNNDGAKFYIHKRTV